MLVDHAGHFPLPNRQGIFDLKIAAAEQVFVVTDSSKFGKVSLSRICGLGDVRAVVTDSEIENSWKKRLEIAGIGLILASMAKVSSSDEASRSSHPHPDQENTSTESYDTND